MDERLYRGGKQFVKFAVVGAIGTIVNLAVLKLTLLSWDQFNASTPFAVEAFASGLAFGFLEFNCPQKAVEYGAAHGALASTTPGDTSMATRAEVEKQIQGGGARVVR